MVTLKEKISGLVATITRATEEGKVTWEPTASDDAFTTTLRGTGLVRVGRAARYDEDGNPSDVYEVAFYDARGRLVEEDSGTSSAHQSLFEMARRSALNSEGVIDKMLQDLKRLQN